MHPFKSAAALLAVGVICAGFSAAAQAPPPVEPARGAPYLVYATHPAKGGAKLSVSSPAFQAGSDIPFENTQYRGNVFPGGPNIRGLAQPYWGPRTPPGPKHRYHFQVFALDTTLTADPAMTWDQLKAAMTDHVLASGEVVGLGQVDPTAPPPPPRPPRP